MDVHQPAVLDDSRLLAFVRVRVVAKAERAFGVEQDGASASDCLEPEAILLRDVIAKAERPTVKE